MSKIKVLFFAADPLSASPDGRSPRLLLDEDVRQIRQKVRAAEHRDALDFDLRLAARADDLFQALNETRPQVVHFSGHGNREGLVLASTDGVRAHPVGAAALGQLFAVFRGDIRVVVLNACLSLPQARAIADVVGCAVGTRGSISDQAAVTFGASFYRAIAFGHPVGAAYDQARLALKMEHCEDLECPELVTRPGVDPGALRRDPGALRQGGRGGAGRGGRPGARRLPGAGRARGRRARLLPGGATALAASRAGATRGRARLHRTPARGSTRRMAGNARCFPRPPRPRASSADPPGCRSDLSPGKPRPMRNLTFEKRLLREHTPEPLEGHTVVVFERVGEAGERFHSVLPPGTPLAKARGILAMFRPQARCFAVAVSAAPGLHLKFREHVVLDDEAGHTFDLLIDLSYAAGDPRVLAAHRSHDPLRRVRERAGRLLARDVSQLDWTGVLYGFAATAQTLAEQRLPELRAFAAGHGIALHAVELGKLLPEEAVAPARETEAELDRIQRDGRIRIARGETERLVRDNENLWALGGAEMDEAAQSVRDAAGVRAASVDARIRALNQVTTGISTPDEFRAVFQGGHPGGGVPGTVPGALPGPGAGLGVRGAAALSAAAGGLGGLLHQVVSATRNVPGTGKRQQVRAALLHLLAETLLEDLGDPAERTKYADRARQLLTTLDPGLLPEELDTLRALANPAHLQSVLAG